MSQMTEDIRKTVRKRLIDESMSQTELAEKIGRSRQQINDMLSGRSGSVSETWLDIFDILGLELVVRSKGPSQGA